MKQLIKKFSAVALAGLLTLFLLPTPKASAAYAPAPTETRYSVEALGDGITVETTTVIYDLPASAGTFSSDFMNSAASSSSKRVSRTSTIKHSGTTIATITLNAAFGYNGSSSWVTSTSYSKTTSLGWVYTNHNIGTSGGTATLSAILLSLIGSVPVYISITCSPSGAIS